MICFTNLTHPELCFVHAPKCSSRTVLGWLALISNPSLLTKHPEYFPEVPEKDYHAYKDIKRLIKKGALSNEAKTVFCIKRDPVKRFISAYKDMHRLQHIGSIETLIQDWDNLLNKKPILKEHFRTQTSFYGIDKQRFSYIFEHTRMQDVKSFLEDYSKSKLPDIHLQKSNSTEIILSSTHINWIYNKYEDDYENEWC